MDIFWRSFFAGLPIYTCIGYLVALTRKSPGALEVEPQRMESFLTKFSPEESLVFIIYFAQKFDYKISNLDEIKHQVVLEQSISLWSYGFFFPIFIFKQSDGSTSISVGIKSKFIQGGPIVSHNFKKCVNGIKASLAEQMEFS